MKKKYSTIFKMLFVATALIITTEPTIQPLWWLAGY